MFALSGYLDNPHGNDFRFIFSLFLYMSYLTTTFTVSSPTVTRTIPAGTAIVALSEVTTVSAKRHTQQVANISHLALSALDRYGTGVADTTTEEDAELSIDSLDVGLPSPTVTGNALEVSEVKPNLPFNAYKYFVGWSTGLTE